MHFFSFDVPCSSVAKSSASSASASESSLDDDDDDDDAPDVDAGIITYRVASSTEESKIEIETLFNPQIVPR
jgi:hypothetical protein